MNNLFASTKRRNKRGQLGNATNIAVGLVVLTLIVAVGAIVLGDFQDSAAECTTGYTYNNSNNLCYNASNTSQTNLAPSNGAFNVSGNGLTGLTNMSAQFGTVGTIAIAAVLITLVVGAFVFARR